MKITRARDSKRRRHQSAHIRRMRREQEAKQADRQLREENDDADVHP